MDINYNGQTYTPDHLREMRGWVNDCVWADMLPEDIEDVTDEEILKGIDKHYVGGLVGFIIDITPIE